MPIGPSGASEQAIDHKILVVQRRGLVPVDAGRIGTANRPTLRALEAFHT